MPSDPFDPQLLAKFQAASQALIAYIPEHFRSAYCIAEQAPQHSSGRLQYQIGSKEHPADTSNRPSPELHDAIYQLYCHWTKEKQAFPGVEASIQHQADGQWQCDVRLLDLDARPRSEEEEEELWQAVYRAREQFFTEQFGPFPEDIQKLMNLTGVWPGGGLYQIVAARRGNIGVCTSFGLTNFDMPARTQTADYQRADDNLGRPIEFSAKLEARTPRWLPPEVAGCGYEVMFLTPNSETWPLLPLSWLVQMEILKDLDLPGRVDDAQGVTVESVKIGDGSQSADFLIEPALPPLPEVVDLPNGKMRLLVATRITRDEMNFALKQGRPDLLDRLVKAGIGQLSILNRPSVV